jgi:transposase
LLPRQDAVQATHVRSLAAVRNDLPRDDYDGSTFAALCDAADEKQRRKPHDPRIERARALMDDDISLERVWHELNSTPGRAASSTVGALMYSLRERGTAALREPATRRRLHELNDDQLVQVGGRLQRLKPKIARAWTASEVEILIKLHGELQ